MNFGRDLTGEEWDFIMDVVGLGGENEMCHACAFNFKASMVLGGRLKFSMAEAYPGAVTSMNGAWFLTIRSTIKRESTLRYLLKGR